MKVTDTFKSEDGMTGWVKYDYLDSPTNLLCVFGLHVLTRHLVMDGYIHYFTRVRRYRCRCGRWEWVKYDGSWVDKQDGRRF